MSPGPTEPLRTQLAAICQRLLPADVFSSAELRAAFLSEIEYVLQTAKLESLAEFAAGAGHEINNPVATITGRAQLLLSGEIDPERRHALEIIGGQALRIRDMIGDVMLFGRPPLPRFEQLDLFEIATQAVASQAELQQRRSASVTIAVPRQTILRADRTQLLVLFSSLLRNSLESADRPGVHVQLMTRTEFKEGQTWTVVTVCDNGPGITEAIREHLFDPFFSGRQAGRGLGFGLCKCWRIMQSHGGEIHFKQPEGSGASFETWWPQRSY
jgi:signal transduction histidine kinase